MHWLDTAPKNVTWDCLFPETLANSHWPTTHGHVASCFAGCGFFQRARTKLSGRRQAHSCLIQVEPKRLSPEMHGYVPVHGTITRTRKTPSTYRMYGQSSALVLTLAAFQAGLKSLQLPPMLSEVESKLIWQRNLKA